MKEIFEVSKTEFLDFFEHLNIGVLIHKGKILYANSCLLHLYGYSSFKEVEGKRASDFVMSGYKEMHFSNMKAALKGKKVPNFVEKTKDANGNVIWIEGVVNKTTFNGEEAVLVFINDITKKMENEERLSQIYRLDLIKRISELLKEDSSLETIGREAYVYCKEHGIADYMYIATVKGDVIKIESAFLKGANIVRRELHREKDRGILWYVVEKKKELYLPNAFDFDIEGYKLVRISNLPLNVPFSYFAIPVERGKEVKSIVAFLKEGYDAFTEIDFTFFNAVTSQIEIAMRFNEIMNELKRERERFRDLAMTDALTGVYTRHFFNEWMENYYEIMKRKGEYATAVMIDINDFKSINDNYGHLVGDRVLRKVGSMLKDSVRKMDLVVRYGGDEFLFIFPQTSQRHVEMVMQRIRSKLSKLKDKFGFEVTISYGSAYVSPTIDYRKALKSADEKMYEMKSKRK